MRCEQAPGPPAGGAASVDLAADAQAPGRARAFLDQYCRTAGCAGEVRRTASLLVSELVTNALVHGRSVATVEIELRAGVLRVAVSDRSDAALPAVDQHPRTSAEGGRGLLIVSRLAARWGVVPAGSGGGKTVWFELDV